MFRARIQGEQVEGFGISAISVDWKNLLPAAKFGEDDPLTFSVPSQPRF